MPTRLELLKQAGFSDAEIGDWATAERQRMQEGGFNDDEIDAEFGVTRPPKEVPAALVERLKQGNAFQRIAGASADWAQHYFGDEPLGFSPANQEALHRLGTIGDIVIPAGKPLDAVLRAVPAGLAAVGAGVGQAVEEAQDAAFGHGPEAGGKAARDFASLAQIAAVLSGSGRTRTGSAPRGAPVRMPEPGTAGEPGIVLPRAEDFRNAAATISGTAASFPTEQKLLRLWTEHGISPTEAAADAMRNRAMAQDLRSDSGKLPDAYTGAAGVPARTDRMDAPAGSLRGAMEAENGAAASPDAPERAPTTAASRDIAMYPPPLIPQRPFRFDYRQPPRTTPDGRLLVDMEGRPLTANIIAGRRIAGGRDEPVTPKEVDSALEQLDIRKVPIPTIPNQPNSVVGLFSGYEDRRRPVGDLYIKSTFSPQDQATLTAHEAGHAIDFITRDLATRLTDQELAELRHVYMRLRGGSGRQGLHPQPETYGYEGDEVNRELLAEGVRAYLTNPNYFKMAAPRAAKTLRAEVNKDRWLKHILQLNSLGGAGIVGAGASGNKTEDDE
jgi:hypothetical protein